MPAIITLTTDFGLADPFVGVMKGVILGRVPDATLVDLTHGIPPQDLMAACFWMGASYHVFPPGTVHLAVVDPGVGTARQRLVVGAHGHVFVGPDNGLFGWILQDPEADVRVIGRDLVDRLGLRPSPTFEGRDVFAPVAAELAAGRLAVAEVSAPGRAQAPSALPPARVSPQRVVGVVAAIDRFGNLITNIPEAALARLKSPLVCVGRKQLALRRTYDDAGPMDYLALINAFEHVEVARAGGDAAAGLGVISGTTVVVVEAPTMH